MFVKHQLCTPLFPGWNHPLHGLNHQHAEAPHIHPSNSDFFSKLYTWTANFPLVNPAGCLPAQHVRMELNISPSSPQTMFWLSDWCCHLSTFLFVPDTQIFTHTYWFSSKLCLNLCLPFCLSNHPLGLNPDHLGWVLPWYISQSHSALESLICFRWTFPFHDFKTFLSGELQIQFWCEISKLDFMPAISTIKPAL